MYIQDQKSFAALVDRLRGAPRLALDTEFVRERSYYPALEIIQIATPEIEAIIDFQRLGTLEPLHEILFDRSTLKILHAAQQDLEIFYNHLGEVPAPLFDTQVAAAMVGLGAQVGYGALVEQLVQVRLKKQETRTDWSRRPLTDQQLEYALDDVRYLLPIHDALTAQLVTLKRERWLDEEWAQMSREVNYERTAPEEAWRRVKGSNRLRSKQLAVLQELAAWREREAVRRDRALPFVVRDEVLVDLAQRTPSSISQLREVRGLHPREVDRQGGQILKAIMRGTSKQKAEWPSHSRGRRLSSEEKALVALMQAWLKAKSNETDIAASYLATSAELHEFVMATPRERRSLALMQGWRGELVGDDLLALMDGQAALAWQPEGGALKLLRADDEESSS